MDGFSPEKLLGEIFLWDEPPLSAATNQGEPPPPAYYYANQSAFVQYNDRDLLPPRRTPRRLGEETCVDHHHQASNSQSMSKRMIGFLRKSQPPPPPAAAAAAEERNSKVEEHERERCFRHMISERMRRQRQRHSCLALHSILPPGTKTDNNSVIQMAAKEIERLQACREELWKENAVLEEVVVESNQLDGGSSSKLHYIRVPYHPSTYGNGIDSMVETLNWLKGQGVDTRSIKSSFSKEELFAVLEIETKMERAMQRRVDEVEWKFRSHVNEGFKRQRLD